jgi:adenine phosphoribosyltransferase
VSETALVSKPTSWTIPLLLAGGALLSTVMALYTYRRRRRVHRIVEDLSEHELRQRIASRIVAHANFPEKGVTFRDILPALRSPTELRGLTRLLVSHLRAQFPDGVDVVLGLESRGFLFGPAIALDLQCGFVPVRKRGKLPGQVVAQDYAKEYGKDTIEVQKGAIPAGARVVIFDDLLATGGTLAAACKLAERCGARVVESLVIIELEALDGRKRVPSPVHALFRY